MSCLEFVRCQRADGSYYGTAGKCLKGREVDQLIEDLFGSVGMSDNAKVLGEGGSATVYDVGHGVVVKKGFVSKEEIDIMGELSGVKGVPRVLGEDISEGGITMAMSKAKGKPLGTLFKEDPELAVEGFNEALLILKEIHSKGIAHLDLHGYNIIYDPSSKTATLIDYGQSRRGSKWQYGELQRLENDLFVGLSAVKKAKGRDFDVDKYENIANFRKGLREANRIHRDDIESYIRSGVVNEESSKKLVDYVWSKV